jgi:hypothetical protein
MNTDHTKWPGENILGQIMKKVSTRYSRKLRSASVPRKGTLSEDNQTNLDKYIRDSRDSSKKRMENKK